MNYEDILLQIEKPGRYLGGEVNSRQSPALGKLNFVLAFPDTYEVGMSHLGMQILYGILVNMPDVFVDRCYAPWVDLEGQLRRRSVLLAALESRRPLKDFDLVGFSLQYELSYTNLLNMLDLGGIPLRREDRSEGAPLVIAGGPGAFNPAPLAEFIDAFVIGEGEEVLREICQAVLAGKKSNQERRERLLALARIEGVYVPGISPAYRPVKKRIVADLDQAFFPEAPLVPLIKTIHDRVVAEIARGCTRGCRFCQAGMVWRPVRERSLPRLLDISHQMLCATGYDELSLLSLSSGDYTRIEELISTLMERYHGKRVALALPSLRVETLSRSMMDAIKQVRKTSFTLAPEAGTKRMRDVINKGNSDEDLLNTAAQVFHAGWRAMKLYFMIGLPGERPEDLEGIIDLGYRVAKTAKPRGQVTISLSTFVPKPHTPFQWERQLALDEVREKQDYFKRRIRGGNLTLRWQDSRMSLLEGLISRGDEKIGRVIKQAFSLGCRFDGWSEIFRFDLWEEALATEGISFNEYLAERSPSCLLPWQVVDCGVTGGYLLGEREKSQAGGLTPDCRIGPCQSCGVCDKQNIRIVLARDLSGATTPLTAPLSAPRPAERFRVTFHKTGPARLISHLDMSSALTRALTRAGLSFVFSEGFHPHPKISFAHATSVGMESLCEFMDIEVERPDEPGTDIIDRINRFLPVGLKVAGMDKIPFNAPSLARTIAAFDYEISLTPSTSLESLEEKINSFLKQDAFLIRRDTSTGEKLKDIRPLVLALGFISGRRRIDLAAAYVQEGSARPGDILTEVLGIPPAEAKLARVIKTATRFHRNR